MDLYRKMLTDILPDRLQRVPIPDSFVGIFKLSVRELASLAVFTGVSGFVAYSVYTTCRLHLSAGCGKKSGGPACVGLGTKVNALGLRKEIPKVADTIEAADIGEKVALCRCWRSRKFPYCDGSHNQHNQDTGDNVGPLLVKK